MKPKLILGLALVLSGGLFGCSTTPLAAGTKVFNYSTPDSGDVVALKGLGKRLSVRVEADSWQALIEKTKPAFAWNGRDMMWIESDTNSQPQFVLDEAYIYQPTNQPLRWVLLDTHDAPFDEWYGEVMGNNLRGVATLHKTVPIADNDAGEIGEYAVVKSSNPKFGTVYEIGWQKLMANGTCLCEDNRRIYVLKDRANQWHFIGEGIGDSSGKSGIEDDGTSVDARVVWMKSKTNDLPFQIQFVCQNCETEASDAPDFVPRPGLVTYDEYILAGTFPAPLRRTTDRSYLLAEKGDTFDKFVEHCAEWDNGWNVWPDAGQKIKNERIIEMWRAGLAQLNPQLPKTGNIKEGTRVQLLTYAETINRLDALEKAERK
jgi:hypothetical protein